MPQTINIYTGKLRSTSVTGGAGVTINTGDNTKFDVDVQGYIVDPATGVKTDVTVTQAGISPTFMGSQNETYVLVDITGTVVQQSTPPTIDQLSTHLTHWVVVHTGSVIDVINELEWNSEQLGDQFSQLCDILEPLKKGLDITEGTTGLRLTREEGRIFRVGIGNTPTNKSTKDFPTASDFSFQYRTSDGTQYPVTQDIDNQQFESSPGVLSTVSTASTVTAQPIYIFPSGNIVVQYGQYEYATTQDAVKGVAKDDFIKEGNIERNGVLLGWVVTKKTASDWSNSDDYVIMSTNITNSYGQGDGELDIQFNGTSLQKFKANQVSDVIANIQAQEPLVSGVNLKTVDGQTLLGSGDIPIPAGLTLGETSTTAYRGDRGKTAYDHSQLTSGNPHNVKASELTDFQTEVSNNPDVQSNTSKVTNATHTGEVTGATILTITPKAVTNNKLADVATKTIKGRTATGSGEPKDLTVAEVRTMLNVADGANVNVQSDWEEMNSAVDAFIKNKPNQTNFNIYNQNKNDKKVVSTTTKTSIITATIGVQALPSYNLNDSFIGKLFGFFDNSGSTRTIQIFFGIGNREYSTPITTAETGIVDFSIDYKIDFPISREASITGVLKVGNTSKYIDLDFAQITGLDYDIKTTLGGGELTVNSSHIHRNYN